MVHRTGNLSVVTIILVALHLACSGASTNVSVDCQQQLDQLWSNYTNPTIPIAGCDSGCLAECKDTIEAAMYTTQIQDCPPQTNITTCLHIFSEAWEEYAQECDLFVISNTSTIQGATSEGESGQSSTASGSSTKAPSPEASPDASPEASPSPAEGESAAAPASAPEAGRRLLAEASIGEGGSSAGVCFPTFSSPSEVEAYIDGEYFEEDYSAPSNTAGIVLSVVFWTSFAALGLFLRR